MSSGYVWLLQASPTPTDASTASSAVSSMFDLLPFAVPLLVGQAISTMVILALAWGVARLLIRLFGRRIAQWFRRPSLTRTALRGLRVAVYLFAVVAIMGVWGLRISDIGLSVAVFSAVVGVVVAPIVGSFISGVFLLADQPYEIGDMVELANREQRGFVEDITLRHTKIFTLDNTFLVIPNGEMRNRDVVNYSAEDPRTRLSLDVLVTYESDIPLARRLIEQSARAVDNVIEGGPDIRVGAARYPAAPTVYINEYGDHGVLLTLRYWVTEPYKLLSARSNVQTNLWEKLGEDVDVDLAYPHSHLYFDETSGEMPISLADREPEDAHLVAQSTDDDGE